MRSDPVMLPRAHFDTVLLKNLSHKNFLHPNTLFQTKDIEMDQSHYVVDYDRFHIAYCGLGQKKQNPPVAYRPFPWDEWDMEVYTITTEKGRPFWLSYNLTFFRKTLVDVKLTKFEELNRSCDLKLFASVGPNLERYQSKPYTARLAFRDHEETFHWLRDTAQRVRVPIETLIHDLIAAAAAMQLAELSFISGQVPTAPSEEPLDGAHHIFDIKFDTDSVLFSVLQSTSLRIEASIEDSCRHLMMIMLRRWEFPNGRNLQKLISEMFSNQYLEGKNDYENVIVFPDKDDLSRLF